MLWDVVLAPSPRTARAGLTEDVIPVGDTVTASGHRHLDPSDARNQDRTPHVERKGVQRLPRPRLMSDPAPP